MMQDLELYKVRMPCPGPLAMVVNAVNVAAD